jgi:tRNA (adenine57-N1/adenine58-N1)-methyltransferase
MADDKTPAYVFREGDHALMVDRKGRRYLIQLKSGASFHTHVGNFPHADLIGQDEGTWVTTGQDHHLLAYKPTLADFTRDMPRIATVVYPKDLGAIITYGDIFPGAVVLEAGAGSGALTLALLRAVGPGGRVIAYDVRADMIERTSSNVASIHGGAVNLELKQGDVYDGFEESQLDRVVLDLPEPWQVVPHASDSLVPGGTFVSFLPTVLQVHELTQGLRKQRTFEMIETFEIFIRTWTVGGRSIRPSHRMIGHTGFITTARRCSPRPGKDDDSSEQAEAAEEV